MDPRDGNPGHIRWERLRMGHTSNKTKSNLCSYITIEQAGLDVKAKREDRSCKTMEISTGDFFGPAESRRASAGGIS